MDCKPVVINGLFPEGVAVGYIQVDIGLKSRGILPVFGEIELLGKVPRQLPTEALNGGIEPGIYNDAVAGGVVLVHALGMVGHDDVGLHLPDDVAHGEANLIVVRDKAVLVLQHIGFAP